MGPTPVVLLLLVFLTYGWCARILVVLPFPGKSHHMFATAIMEALVERGHTIIEYSPFPPKTTNPNHTHHELQTTFGQNADSWTFEDVRNFVKEVNSFVFDARIQEIWDETYGVCEETLIDERIRNLMTSEENIDLVMAETTFGQESLLILGHILSAPTIVLETLFPHSLLNWIAGNSLSLSSIPDMHADQTSSEKMSFLERTVNLISTVRLLYLYHNVQLPKQEALVKRTVQSLGIKKFLPLSQLVAEVPLYLINSHPAAVNYVTPYTPNMVAIGGVTINPEKQQLTQDLKQFMDTAEEGVIYISFGSFIPTHSMTKETFKIFINAFKRLPQKIIWKIDMASVNVQVDLPPNVKTVKWAPQLGVLGHSRCLVFITHGGLFSQQEAMYAGVPTVGLPFFSDQPYNVRYSESRGIGVRLPLDRLDEHTLYEAITAVLNNPKYRENARKMSRIYRDRPVPPKNLAVYWVEYVLRHRGAPHLRPASATMAWYKLFLLDVVAIIVTAVLVVLFIVYVTTVHFWAMLTRREKKKEHTKQN